MRVEADARTGAVTGAGAGAGAGAGSGAGAVEGAGARARAGAGAQDNKTSRSTGVFSKPDLVPSFLSK